MNFRIEQEKQRQTTSNSLPSNFVPHYQMPILQTNTNVTFDPRNIEIKTKSVEQTLLPLVTQVNIKNF